MRNLLEHFDRLNASDNQPCLMRLGRLTWLLPRKAIALLITCYQATLSPDHGPLRHLYHYGYCRHSPTCSEFGKHIVLERGVVIGGFLTAKRLMSCHPWRKPSPQKIMEISHPKSVH